MAFSARQKQKVGEHLRAFEFRQLFLELGWDHPADPAPLTPDRDDLPYTLTPIAAKRNFTIFVQQSDTIPPADVRGKLETWLNKRNREHLIIFTDGAQSEQQWLWVRREPGQPLRRRSESWHRGQSGEKLLQKLEQIAIAFEEEDGLTLVDVSGRVRAAFNVERATRSFYNRFKRERDKFEKFVEGITAAGDQDWYVSVMLNRLMFVYFIQKKGFLDGDPNYLRNRLRRVQQERGDDQFHTFYRYFLLRLFHEGLGRPVDQRNLDPALERLIGRIPYLNGGIFQLHEIEQRYPEIQIADEAFEEILDFFDEYHWHLDDRALRNDNEINPDVLGYIFEKYINQKQMGAYYTKEDITGYISQNTILPYLLDRVRQRVAGAFEPDGFVWGLLRADPDRYIYAAVRHGTELSLPDSIAAGVDDVSARGDWNTPAPPEYGLPTEIWRETVARRERYERIRAQIERGEVTEINDLITLNLDIVQFVQDLVEQSEGADLLNAMWTELNAVTVLDPTCGSGAFLFAALNILQPLYEGCVARMRDFVGSAEWCALHPVYTRRFQRVERQIAAHPNESYFVFKSIMVNNLYGVDIMAEAVEICKLRLFLKLAATVQKDGRKENLGIEPLPDIDFNVRTGNTLVGFATLESVRAAILGDGAQQKLLLTPEEQEALDAINDGAADVARLTQKFREQQTEIGGEVTLADKRALRQRLADLDHELNRYLAQEYGVDPDDGKAFAKWRESHQPFHWFTEFYGIVEEQGGFDVIIGNPPYLSLSSLKEFSVANYYTAKTRNLYSVVLERCCDLSSNHGRQGYIVPVSSISTDGYSTLQDVILRQGLFVSSYDDRPSHLFSGLDKNTLSILLLLNDDESSVASTRLRRWTSDERQHLFHTVEYVDTKNSPIQNTIPKIGNSIEVSIWKKLFGVSARIGNFAKKNGRASAYYSRKVNSFLQALDFIPQVRNGKGELRAPSEFKELQFNSEVEAEVVFCCFNSTLFRWFLDR